MHSTLLANPKRDSDFNALTMVTGLSKVRANLICNHPYELVAQDLSSFFSPPQKETFAPAEGAAIKDPGNEVRSPISYAPINVKPQGGGGAATHGKLTRRAFPWVEILIVGFLGKKRYLGVGI